MVCSTLGPATVCGRCIESHAELLRQVNERRRRQSGDT
jgi:AhpD family alkylhydroperoxidase